MKFILKYGLVFNLQVNDFYKLLLFAGIVFNLWF